MIIATGQVDRKSPKQFLICTFNLCALLLAALFQIIFWPIQKIFERFVSEGRYLTSHGKEKIDAQKKSDDTSIIS